MPDYFEEEKNGTFRTGAGEGGRKAVLVGARLPGETEDEFVTGMDELAGLAKALGLTPAAEVVQNIERPDPATYIGSGKVEELCETIDRTRADVAVFNNTLSPSQLTNVGRALSVEVVDRTGIILNIFSERARSREARLQTDYAHLQYMLPRLVGLRTNLSRQGGTGGSLSNKGSGEKKIELDRRKIQREMAAMRRELSEIEKTRSEQRKKRHASGIPLVALVGYTNAGKSSLMNRFLSEFGGEEEKEVYTEDMLFATLDTSVRRITPPEARPFLLSDTVGFISDLPTGLVQAFRATLEEALYADLLLDVVDVSDPDYRMHMRVTERTLKELGAGDIPVIHVMNKAERVYSDIPRVSGDRVFVSVKNNIGTGALLSAIEEALAAGRKAVTLVIPYDRGGLESSLRAKTVVNSVSYEADGIKIAASLTEDELRQYAAYISHA